MQTDTCNVVAVFDDYPTAERAVRDLVQNGIPREAIDVRSNFMTEAAGSTGAGSESEREEGGIAGFLHRMFGTTTNEEESGHYAEAVRRGHTVLCATAKPDQLDRAVEILNRNGAVDIDRQVENFRQTGYQRFDPNAPAYTAAEVAHERARYPRGEQSAIPVVEEELQIGKRVVRRGGVRVYTHVVAEPVEEQVRLREEHVTVERRAVNRPVGAGDLAALRDQSIEVPEMAEEPVISKRARVKEEVIVGKEATERTATIRDHLRHTEVEVEPLPGADYHKDFRRDYELNYAHSGLSYEALEPAYLYGYRMGSEPRYIGKPWSEVEPQLKAEYLRAKPDTRWDVVRGALHYGWERATAKR